MAWATKQSNNVRNKSSWLGVSRYTLPPICTRMVSRTRLLKSCKTRLILGVHKIQWPLASAAHWRSISELNCIQPHHSSYEGYLSTSLMMQHMMIGISNSSPQTLMAFAWSNTGFAEHFLDFLLIIHGRLIEPHCGRYLGYFWTQLWAGSCRETRVTGQEGFVWTLSAYTIAFANDLRI